MTNHATLTVPAGHGLTPGDCIRIGSREQGICRHKVTAILDGDVMSTIQIAPAPTLRERFARWWRRT